MRQLVPHEPRLAKKLVEPLLHLIQTKKAISQHSPTHHDLLTCPPLRITYPQAKSLQYECLATVAATMSSQPELAQAST